LAKSCVTPVNNKAICATAMVKSGERNAFLTPFEDVVNGFTQDSRARSRLINPNHGDKHNVWATGLMQDLFAAMFPYSYIKGLTSSELVART
jgi:hypothetical protein